MDIAHDRAGYYLVWGCLNWVPGFYTSQPLYLTKHPIDLTQPVAIAILVAGIAMIYINWEADDQRQRFRASDGEDLVWGRKPEYIVAKYVAGVASSRHVHVYSGPRSQMRRHHHHGHTHMILHGCPAAFRRILLTRDCVGFGVAALRRGSDDSPPRPL